MRSLIAGVLLASTLLGCGGGDTTSVGASVPIAALAGSATLDAAGGKVEARLAGGTSVILSVPAGALKSSLSVTITPIANPVDTLGAFTISPAGLVFAKPASLTVTLPSGVALDPDTVVLMGRGNVKIPLGASINAANRSISIDLSSLDMTVAPLAIDPSLFGKAASPRAMMQNSQIGAAALLIANNYATKVTKDNAAQVTFYLQRRSYAGRVSLLQELVSVLNTQGNNENALNVYLVMQSVLSDPRGASDVIVQQGIVSWKSVVCRQQQFSVSALDTFAGSDVVTFRQRAKDVFTWDIRALELNALLASRTSPVIAGCLKLDPDYAQPVRARLPAFANAVARALNLLNPLEPADFDQLFNLRFVELFDLAADFGDVAVDLQNDVVKIVKGQLSSIRTTGFGICRVGSSQSLQAKLLAKVVGEPLVRAAAGYGELDLHEDIQVCGVPIRWTLFDDSANVLSQGKVGAIAIGQISKSATININGASKLSLSGPLGALLCPEGSQNNERLSFTAGPLAGAPTSVQTLTSSNGNTYLEVSTLDFDVQALYIQGARKIDIMRTGGLCNGGFANLSVHATLATLLLDAEVTITTSSTPDAIIETIFSSTLSASGGREPYTWSAMGLPAGLALNATSGVVSGTPTSAGTSTVVLTVTSADGHAAQRSLLFTVGGNRTLVGSVRLESHADYLSSGVHFIENEIVEFTNVKVNPIARENGSFVASGNLSGSVTSFSTETSTGCTATDTIIFTGLVTGLSNGALYSENATYTRTATAAACAGRPALETIESGAYNGGNLVFYAADEVVSVRNRTVLVALRWHTNFVNSLTGETITKAGEIK